MVLILAALVGVGAWISVRVTSTVAAKQEIETKRKTAPAAFDEVPVVQVTRAEAALWTPVLPFEGTIDARQRAELGFKVGGRLGSVGVRLGDKVKAGQLLGQLDAAEASAQRQAASAQLDAARAQVALAVDQESRTGRLVETGALASAQGVQAEQQRALAQAQAAAANAQLGLAQTTLANHVLVAPFAGVVTRAPSTRGAVVTPGQSLFEVVDNSKALLRGTVNEADAEYFREGAPVTVGGAKVGTVRVIVNVLDRITRRVPVEAELDPNQDLRVGSFVRATIGGAEKIPVFRVPGTALRPGSQGTLMIVEGDTLREAEVRFAVEAESGALLVRSGLQAHELVVVAPRPESKTGDRVKVAPREKAGEVAHSGDGAVPVVEGKK